MSVKSKIEWTDATWTPIRARVKTNAAEIAVAKGYTSLVQIAERMAGRVGPHCEHVSPGCDECYSGANNCRCLPVNGTGLPFDRRARDLVDIFMDDRILMQPLKWCREKWIFVCSQTDLFGDFVAAEMIDRVFAVMALSPRHSFQVLTKRPERMHEYFADMSHRQEAIGLEAQRISGIARFLGGEAAPANSGSSNTLVARWPLPLPNVLLGVSIEDRNRLSRIEPLFDTPAAMRFVSLEPLLEDLGDIRGVLIRHCSECGREFTGISQGCSTPGCHGHPRGRLDWVIVGGESGRRARPCDPWSVRSIRDQSVSAGVPIFFKQWGAWMPVENLPLTGNRAIAKRAREGMVRMSKKRAGCLLDGRTWKQMPSVQGVVGSRGL
jgi:protein gp37